MIKPMNPIGNKTGNDELKIMQHAKKVKNSL